MRTSRWFAVVVAAGLVLAGCGSQHASSPVPTRSVGGGTHAWTSCQRELRPRWPVSFTTDTLTLTPLGHAFDAASVVVCGEQTESRGDGGQELVATEQRGTAVAALEAALRLPDQPATSVACAADLQTVPWFAVLDRRGRWVRPGLPFDECHQPRIEVTDALRALPLTTVSVTPVQLLQSGAAVRSGCDMRWTDILHVETGSIGDAQPIPTRADPFTGISRIRICLYDVPRSEFGGDKPAGTFITGGVLSGGPRLDLGSLFTGLPAAVTCSQEATRFAVITQIKVGQLPMAYLELDGCHRLLVQAWVKPGSYDKQVSTLSQASPALVSAVDRFRPSP